MPSATPFAAIATTAQKALSKRAVFVTTDSYKNARAKLDWLQLAFASAQRKLSAQARSQLRYQIQTLSMSLQRTATSMDALKNAAYVACCDAGRLEDINKCLDFILNACRRLFRLKSSVSQLNKELNELKLAFLDLAKLLTNLVIVTKCKIS